MAKAKITRKLRRCKNENCNEVYEPQKNDSGYCPDCEYDWQPEKPQFKGNNEHYHREVE